MADCISINMGVSPASLDIFFHQTYSKPMILHRYLNKETLTTMFAVTGILIFILMCNQFARYLNDAANGRMSAYAVMQMMSLQIPLLAGFMIPLGLYIGILLSYGRLYADSEMTILLGSGISRWQLLGITFMGAAFATLLSAVLMIWVEPQMAWYRDHIISQGLNASPLERVSPGRFQVIDKKLIFYVDSLSRDKTKLEQVFVAEIPKDRSAEKKQIYNVITAKSAHQVVHPRSKEAFVEFNEGHRYIGEPGANDYQIIDYKKYGVRIPQLTGKMKTLEEFMPTRDLWREQARNKLAAAELQWRLSMPISVMILALIAVPLSRVRPRQGRYAKLVPAILIYMVYMDLMFVSQSWVQKGIVSSTIGMWWVHGLMLCVGIALQYERN